MIGILKKIFGTKQEREIKRLSPYVEEINKVYEKLHGLKDEELIKKTEDFVKRLKEGEDDKSVMIDAFALVKEACRRLVGKKWLVRGIETEWNMIPFDVQLMGAVVLHEGKIAEMKTGEGKTLVATMPLYLNALVGRARGLKGEKDFLVEQSPRGVCHLVTVNDYLAARDREWMGPVYESLGLTVGVIQQGMRPEERKPEYNSDITYGTNNEFGFDYLRDNMVVRWEDKVQRGHHYAIVDEIDSILIDEARTPLIISGPTEPRDMEYSKWNPAVERLYRSQIILVNRIVDEAERLLKEGKEFEAGKKLLQAKRGIPKHKKLMKLEEEPGIKRLIEDVELRYIREKKLHQLDEELYFVVDEKQHTVDITEKGRQLLSPNDPELFVLPDLATKTSEIDKNEKLTPKEKAFEKEKLFEEYAKKNEILHNIHALIKAYTLFERDVDYIVQDGKVIIVDEFTGRLMPGRRFSDGLHEALEAKERVRIQEETQTLATITLQNYFRMYEKLAGMTGTAATEANEFWHIYKLEVVVIPTNKPVRRIDYPDVIYKTKREKYNAVIEEIVKWHKRGRPILVGTTSVEVSELLSRMLKRRGINHNVLNAKHHQREAEIVAKAGERGAVTIATNMAGRGTDIKLGEGVRKCEECYMFNPEAQKDPEKAKLAKKCAEEVPCGLYIIGTEKHEARRIDNQLRGRSGRQGDPGSSRFFLSLEDDLLRLFGADRMSGLMEKFGPKEGEPIQSYLATKAIEDAQKRVEKRNFEIRKRLLEFDDVMNKQREVVYSLRDEILRGENLSSIFHELIEAINEKIIETYALSRFPEEWDWNGIQQEFISLYLTDITKPTNFSKYTKKELLSEMNKKAKEAFEKRKQEIGEEQFEELQKLVLLSNLDHKWKDHLYQLDIIKEGISLRAYGQKDPLIEYQQESFRLFEQMMEEFRRDAIRLLFRAQLRPQTVRREIPTPVHAARPRTAGVAQGANPDPNFNIHEYIRKYGKPGRNAPCPCGSGKKFKKCHGRFL